MPETPDLTERARVTLTAAIRAVTDAWEEPLDEVHDVPQVVNSVLAWAAQQSAAAERDGYCVCHPDRPGSTPDCGIRAHRAAAAERVSVSAEVVRSLGESYAYDRWPDQTVQDEPELIEAGMEIVTGWLHRAVHMDGVLTVDAQTFDRMSDPAPDAAPRLRALVEHRLDAAEVKEVLTCRTFSDKGVSICEEPARYIVWGHLFEKRDKGPKCAKHLPQTQVAPWLRMQAAIYEISQAVQVTR